MEIDDEGLDYHRPQAPRRDHPEVRLGPVGVAALAAVLAEEVETIEDVYEPFLLRLGFLDRTPQGRIATEAARQHLAGLGYEIPPPRRAEPEMPPCGTTCRRADHGGFGPFGWALVVLGVIIVVVGLVFVTGGRIRSSATCRATSSSSATTLDDLHPARLDAAGVGRRVDRARPAEPPLMPGAARFTVESRRRRTDRRAPGRDGWS